MEKQKLKFKKLLYVLLTTSIAFLFGGQVFAATVQDHSDFNNAQNSGTLQVENSTLISFIKNDGTFINWDNPLTQDSGSSFGMNAQFNLSNIDSIIDKVSAGEIGNISEIEKGFISQLKGYAIISGSFDINIDLNAGLGDYFTVNQDVLSQLNADPNQLIAMNPAYESVFNVDSVTENGNNIVIKVSVNSGVTGAKLLELKNNFGTLDFVAPGLFDLNSDLWNDVDQINMGEFDNLVTISSVQDEAIFIVKIPQNLLPYASMVGARNPYVGVKLESSPGTGSLNLGFILAYDGNGNTSGEVPVDELSPYNNGTTAVIQDSGTLEKENARFVGWNTEPDGSGITYQTGDIIDMNKSQILYAMWESAYKLTYDLNDSEAYPASRNNGVAYEMLALNSAVTNAPHYTQEPTRNGFTFQGWYLDAEGNTPVGSEILNSDLTVYAKWKANYIISFNTDGNGTLTNGEEQSHKDGDFLTILPTTNADDGYEFSHWVDTKGNIYTNSELKAYTVSSDETFTVVFVKVKSFDSDTSSSSKNDNLPSAGSDNSILPMIVGIILVLLTLGTIIYRKFLSKKL